MTCEFLASGRHVHDGHRGPLVQRVHLTRGTTSVCTRFTETLHQLQLVRVLTLCLLVPKAEIT